MYSLAIDQPVKLKNDSIERSHKCDGISQSKT